MNEETGLIKTTDPIGDGHDVTLVADTPAGLIGMQASLLEWSASKLAAERAELADIEQSIEIARKAKWSMVALRARRVKAADRVLYYEKIKMALEEGYILFPPLTNDITLFAVRAIAKGTPGWDRRRTNNYQVSYVVEVEPTRLDIGDGEYVSNDLKYRHWTNEKDAKGNDVKVWGAPNEFGKIQFPLAMCRAQVIESASDAMAKLLFDALGVSIPPGKNRDPVIIGRVYSEKINSQRRYCDFLISWRIDTREI